MITTVTSCRGLPSTPSPMSRSDAALASSKVSSTSTVEDTPVAHGSQIGAALVGAHGDNSGGAGYARQIAVSGGDLPQRAARGAWRTAQRVDPGRAPLSHASDEMVADDACRDAVRPVRHERETGIGEIRAHQVSPRHAHGVAHD